MTRVLYVDDDADIREVAVFALELDDGFEVRSADSGLAALKLLAEWVPDIILLDVQMPELDGPTTLVRLRAMPNLGALPVVFITARAQPGELDLFAGLDAQGVIPKPFDPMTLAEQVRGFLAA